MVRRPQSELRVTIEILLGESGHCAESLASEPKYIDMLNLVVGKDEVAFKQPSASCDFSILWFFFCLSLPFKIFQKCLFRSASSLILPLTESLQIRLPSVNADDTKFPWKLERLPTEHCSPYSSVSFRIVKPAAHLTPELGSWISEKSESSTGGCHNPYKCFRSTPPEKILRSRNIIVSHSAIVVLDFKKACRTSSTARRSCNLRKGRSCASSALSNASTFETKRNRPRRPFKTAPSPIPRDISRKSDWYSRRSWMSNHPSRISSFVRAPSFDRCSMRWKVNTSRPPRRSNSSFIAAIFLHFSSTSLSGRLRPGLERDSCTRRTVRFAKGGRQHRGKRDGRLAGLVDPRLFVKCASMAIEWEEALRGGRMPSWPTVWLLSFKAELDGWWFATCREWDSSSTKDWVVWDGRIEQSCCRDLVTSNSYRPVQWLSALHERLFRTCELVLIEIDDVKGWGWGTAVKSANRYRNSRVLLNTISLSYYGGRHQKSCPSPSVTLLSEDGLGFVAGHYSKEFWRPGLLMLTLFLHQPSSIKISLPLSTNIPQIIVAPVLWVARMIGWLMDLEGYCSYMHPSQGPILHIA